MRSSTSRRSTCPSAPPRSTASTTGSATSSFPHYVTAIDALNAAGVAFTSSAGNEAVTNAISAPACLSTALSAGAVYPDRHSLGRLGGAGNEFCVDRSVAARLGRLLLQLGERARPARSGRLLAGRSGRRRRRGFSRDVRLGARGRGRRGAPAPGAARPVPVRHREPPARDGQARRRRPQRHPRRRASTSLAAIDLPEEAFGAFDGDAGAPARRRRGPPVKPPRPSRDSPETSQASRPSSRSSTTTRGSSSRR